MATVGTPLLWIGFTALVVALVALDLGLLSRRHRDPSVRESAVWSLLWVGCSLVFYAWIVFAFGATKGTEYLTGYMLEKALAVDNIFVFLVTFSAFKVPANLQRHVLLWGVLGALAMRGILIVLSAALLARFHWIIYVFGALLVLSGCKLFLGNGNVEPEKTLAYRLFVRFIPMVTEFHDRRFFVRSNGRRYATPLLLVLVVVESVDMVFAVDSIPAVFAVTEDPFVVYTSNIFALLGLRSMYFVLRGMVERFEYLQPAMGGVLVFVGTKMLLVDAVHVPVAASLTVVAGIVGLGMAASWWSGVSRQAHERDLGAGSASLRAAPAPAAGKNVVDQEPLTYLGR